MYTIVKDAYDDASLPLVDRLFNSFSLWVGEIGDILDQKLSEPSDARLWWSYVTFVMQVAEPVKY